MKEHFIRKPIEECQPGDLLDMGIFAGFSPKKDCQGPNTLNVRLKNGNHYTETKNAKVRVWIKTA